MFYKIVIDGEYKSIPIAIQYLKGGYGSIDMGAMMAMLVLAILSIIIFYLCCQNILLKAWLLERLKGKYKEGNRK